MADTLIRTITTDNNFRAIALEATDLMNEASQFHDATPLGTEILGRALISSLLVSNAVLKGEERLAITIDGGGPAGRIITEASATGEVRGYVENPRVNLARDDKGRRDVANAVGIDGFVNVTKQMDDGDNHVEQFTGQVELLSGRIDDDLTYYMIKSEQIDSVLIASVEVLDDGTVRAAGGVIVSALPDATKADLDKFYANAQKLGDVATILANSDGPLAIVEHLFGARQVKVLATTDVALFPDITKHEYARMLATLPLEQLQIFLEEDLGAEIVDKFTGKQIIFDADDLRAIIEAKQANSAD
ncbi:MAG: Hsp33 family molecular chaperone HslO [Lactobacillaceae bacterium]|nr:Hsp33 family molecular chaperone HslO [Lactobacillaceae bacterium]